MQPWLYIVIIGACIIVYAYLRPKDAISRRTAAVNDIEITLEQFAEELEEGNKELMVSVSGLKRELEAEINKLNGRLSVLENSTIRAVGDIDSQTEQSKLTTIHQLSEQTEEKPKTRRVIRKQEDKQDIEEITLNQDELTIPTNKPPENDIKHRYGAIFELYEQGKSIEYIAKNTGMNKGEIQLIIQLARQEEQFRA